MTLEDFEQWLSEKCTEANNKQFNIGLGLLTDRNPDDLHKQAIWLDRRDNLGYVLSVLKAFKEGNREYPD